MYVQCNRHYIAAALLCSSFITVFFVVWSTKGNLYFSNILYMDYYCQNLVILFKRTELAFIMFGDSYFPLFGLIISTRDKCEKKAHTRDSDGTRRLLRIPRALLYSSLCPSTFCKLFASAWSCPLMHLVSLRTKVAITIKKQHILSKCPSTS